MDVRKLNLDLCTALGIKDPKTVSKVTLTIEPARLPQIVVERDLMTADGLQTAVHMLQLSPVHIGGTVNQEPEARPQHGEALIPATTVHVGAAYALPNKAEIEKAVREAMAAALRRAGIPK